MEVGDVMLCVRCLEANVDWYNLDVATGVVVLIGLDTERAVDATDIVDIRLADREGGGRVGPPEVPLWPGRGGARCCPLGEPKDKFEYPADFLGMGTGTGVDRVLEDEARLLLVVLTTLGGRTRCSFKRSWVIAWSSCHV